MVTRLGKHWMQCDSRAGYKYLILHIFISTSKIFSLKLTLQNRYANITHSGYFNTRGDIK